MTLSKNQHLVKYISSFLLFELLCYLANAMIMPSMVEVVSYFHAAKSSISSTVMIYIFGVTITPLFLSPIANKFGKSKVIVIGCALFALANLLCPLSQNIIQFFLLRFMQGIAQGFIFLGYTMIHESFDDVSSVKLTSIMSNISVVAPIIGPPIGSLIFLGLGWKFVFIFTGIVSLFSLIGLIIWRPREDISKIKSINFIEQFEHYKFILSSKKFLLGVLILTLAMVPSELWMIFSIIIILTSLKTSLLMYNVYMLIVTLSFILSSLVLGKIIHMLNFKKLVFMGSAISVAASICDLMTSSHSLIFVIFLSISVFGAGLFRGIIYRRLMTDVHEDKNTISALFNLLLSLFLVFVIYIADLLFKSANYSLMSFGLCIFVASGICMLLSIYFMSMPGPVISQSESLDPSLSIEKSGV